MGIIGSFLQYNNLYQYKKNCIIFLQRFVKEESIIIEESGENISRLIVCLAAERLRRILRDQHQRLGPSRNFQIGRIFYQQLANLLSE